jgi:hypothetical protein
VPLNVLNISAERESYARPAHHLIHNVPARALDKRRSTRALDAEASNLAYIPGIRRNSG